jgi:hypothetical protein
MEKGDAAIQLHKRKLMNADKLEQLCKAYLDAKGCSAKVDATVALMDFVSWMTDQTRAVYKAMEESESNGDN